MTDAWRARQLIGHLVENALGYTPEGGGVVVSSRLERRSWEIHVSDTGPGIAPEDVPKVFEPFVRFPHSGRKRAMDTHGLGLTICRVLVEQMGGQITIRPASGGGTQVLVRLPFPDRASWSERDGHED